MPRLYCYIQNPKTGIVSQKFVFFKLVPASVLEHFPGQQVIVNI